MQFNARFLILASVATVTVIYGSELPLDGMRLHCCTIAEYPIVSPSNHSRYGYKGLAFEYLKDLENMLGFRCATMHEYADHDTSFTKFTEHMENCTKFPEPSDPLCKCELGVGGWVPTKERMGRVLYLPSYLRLDTHVLTHVDNTTLSTSGTFFISAFTPFVWMLIGILFLLFTFVRMLDLRFERPPHEYRPLPDDAGRIAKARHFLLKSHIPYRLRKAGQRTALEMAQQVEPREGMKRNSTRQWILTFGVMLVGLFFVLIYGATMTASLVQDRVTSTYRTADDFRSCRINVSDICIPRGGAEESYWRNSFAHEQCSGGRLPRFINSYADVIEMVANKTCKFVMAGAAQSGDAISGKHCASVVRVGEPVFWGALSAVMPLNANRTLFNLLRDTTRDLLERGELQSLSEYYEKKGACFRGPNESLSYARLKVFFYVAFAFLFVMFVVMIVDPQREPEEETIDLESGYMSRTSIDGRQVLGKTGPWQTSFDHSQVSLDITIGSSSQDRFFGQHHNCCRK